MDITENTWGMFGYLKGNESSASDYWEVSLYILFPYVQGTSPNCTASSGIFSLSILANRIITKNTPKIRILLVLNLFTRIVFQVVVLVAFFLFG